VPKVGFADKTAVRCFCDIRAAFALYSSGGRITDLRGKRETP